MEFFWIWLYVTMAGFSKAIVFPSIIIILISLIGIVIFTFYTLDEVQGEQRKENLKDVKKYLKILVTFIFAIVFCNSAVPDKEELAWIVGGGIALKVAQMEQAQQIPSNVLDATNRFLKSIAPDKPIETTKE